MLELQRRMGCSSNDRALASHVRGTGINTRHLQILFLFNNKVMLLYHEFDKLSNHRLKITSQNPPH